VLADAAVSATFFVVGSAARGEPGILLREVRDGHEVHSWDHPQLTHLTDAGITSELDRTAEAVADVAGRRPTLVRPPYGDLNRRVVRVIEAPVILWSVDPQDWLYRNADTVYHRVTAQTRPGSIVLMHDIHPTTVDAVHADHRHPQASALHVRDRLRAVRRPARSGPALHRARGRVPRCRSGREGEAAADDAGRRADGGSVPGGRGPATRQLRRTSVRTRAPSYASTTQAVSSHITGFSWNRPAPRISAPK
jgi:hypothetical protein